MCVHSRHRTLHNLGLVKPHEPLILELQHSTRSLVSRAANGLTERRLRPLY